MANRISTTHRDHRLEIDHDEGSVIIDDLRGARIIGDEPKLTVSRSTCPVLQWSGSLQELATLLELGIKARELHKLVRG